MTTLPIANVFQPLIDVFDSVLVFFHDHVGLGWGMSIVALTVCVRAVLIPLTLKQFRSMQGLQKLAPEIKELQAKYKDDKQRLNQEMMKLYQEHKVNPFGSCLPLVLQLPVFFSLFYMLRKDLKIDICGPKEHIVQVAAQQGKTLTSIGCDQVDPGSASFLFINDLTAKATGVTLVILLVLYVGSQLLSGVLMSVTADRNQRLIMIALPFVFVPFIQGFPAGLIVYWITTNLWTVAQQYIIRRRAGLPVRGAPIPAAAALSGGEDRARKSKGSAETSDSSPEAKGSRKRSRAAKASGKQATVEAQGDAKEPAASVRGGKRSAQAKGGGQQSAEAKGGGQRSAEAKGGGQRSAQAKGGGQRSAEAKGGGKPSVQAKGGGDESAEAKGGGKQPRDGDGAAPERERRTTAPPPPPRQRRKKKTGRRR
jgi:YidC/Oxa1 family membrane protein insertase